MTPGNWSSVEKNQGGLLEPELLARAGFTVAHTPDLDSRH